jgi:thiol-disulfide isomerase/thioredoxin
MKPSLLLLILASGCAATAPSLEPDTTRLKRTGQPIDFGLVRFPGGEKWRLSQEHGSVVLLDVWATWCEPCRDALPLYDGLRKRYAEKGLVVYAVNVDDDPKGIPEFLTSLKVALPVLLDPKALVAEATLKVKMMPTSLLVDRQGVVREVHEGFDADLDGTLVPQIDALLAEPPLAPAGEPSSTVPSGKP